MKGKWRPDRKLASERTFIMTVVLDKTNFDSNESIFQKKPPESDFPCMHGPVEFVCVF